MRRPGWLSREGRSTTTGQRSSFQRTMPFLLAGAALLISGIIVGIYLFFPAEALRQRLVQEINQKTRAEVQIGKVSLIPLLTIEGSRISVAVNGLPQPLTIDEMALTPQWSTLLSGDPGAQLAARMMNGTVDAGMTKSGAISASAEGLRFDLPIQKPISFNITGLLDKASLDSALGLAAKTKTVLSLRLDKVNIVGLEIFKADSPGLSLGEITLELDGQGRALRINTLSAKGGDLEVDGSGTLQVGRSAASSRIKLALQVRPGPNADPTITSLLEISGKPDSDGRYPLQLIGSLAKPLLKPGG